MKALRKILLSILLSATAWATPLAINPNCSSNLPSAYNNVPYSQSFSGIGGVSPYTWVLASGSLPSGITFTQTGGVPPAGDQGVVTGTTTSLGTYHFVVQVTDSAATVVQTNTCTLIVANAPLYLKSASVPGASQGAVYNFTPLIQGGTPPLTFSISAGLLPPSISLNSSTGTLSGTVGAADPIAEYEFTYQVADSFGQTASFPYYLGVRPALTTHGGSAHVKVPGCHPTGVYQVLLAQGRWVLADDTCGAVPYLGVQTASYQNYLTPNTFASHYNNNATTWANHMNQELQQWGFSTWGTYGINEIQTTFTHSPVQMPSQLFMNVGSDVANYPASCGIASNLPIKDLQAGVNAAVHATFDYTTYSADFFDPGYQGCAQHEVNQFNAIFGGNMRYVPWITIIVFDDPGTDAGNMLSGNDPYANMGYVTAVSNPAWQGTYTEGTSPTNYSKAAWITYLQTTYGAGAAGVTALNAAWGTGGTYTQWDSTQPVGYWDSIINMTITNGGTGYALNNQVILYQKGSYCLTGSPAHQRDPNGCGAIYSVSRVSGSGAILALSAVNGGGTGYAPGTVAATTLTGNGSGAVINITLTNIGTGVADEDGRHSWMGTSPFLPDAGNANATARTDMNNFLRSYAHQWAAIPVGAIKQIDPKHLIFGPNNLAGGQVTVPYLRTPILLGLKDAGVDGLYTSWRPSLNDIAMAKLAYDTTGLPIIEWIGWAANCDSSFNINYDAGSGTPNGTYPKCGAQGDNYPFQNYTYQTSPSRAIAYFNAMPLLYNATGADGMYYIIGADWWDLQDYPRHEDTNWGLLTMADNAYDGNCTIPTVNGVQKFDAFGYKCGNPDDTPDPTWLTVGGGAAGYGAFLPTVTKSNLIWWNSLLNYYSNQGRTGGSNVTGGLWTGDIH